MIPSRLSRAGRARFVSFSRLLLTQLWCSSACHVLLPVFVACVQLAPDVCSSDVPRRLCCHLVRWVSLSGSASGMSAFRRGQSWIMRGLHIIISSPGQLQSSFNTVIPPFSIQTEFHLQTFSGEGGFDLGRLRVSRAASEPPRRHASARCLVSRDSAFLQGQLLRGCFVAPALGFGVRRSLRAVREELGRFLGRGSPRRRRGLCRANLYSCTRSCRHLRDRNYMYVRMHVDR